MSDLTHYHPSVTGVLTTTNDILTNESDWWFDLPSILPTPEYDDKDSIIIRCCICKKPVDFNTAIEITTVSVDDIPLYVSYFCSDSCHIAYEL